MQYLTNLTYDLLNQILSHLSQEEFVILYQTSKTFEFLKNYTWVWMNSKGITFGNISPSCKWDLKFCSDYYFPINSVLFYQGKNVREMTTKRGNTSLWNINLSVYNPLIKRYESHIQNSGKKEFRYIYLCSIIRKYLIKCVQFNGTELKFISSKKLEFTFYAKEKINFVIERDEALHDLIVLMDF